MKRAFCLPATLKNKYSNEEIEESNDLQKSLEAKLIVLGRDDKGGADLGSITRDGVGGFRPDTQFIKDLCHIGSRCGSPVVYRQEQVSAMNTRPISRTTFLNNESFETSSRRNPPAPIVRSHIFGLLNTVNETKHGQHRSDQNDQTRLETESSKHD